MEIGWVESNHAPYNTSGWQILMTNAWVNKDDWTPYFHYDVSMIPGSEASFRQGPCGGPGEYNVCWEVWNGSGWTILRYWVGAMRCELPTGAGNCRFNFFNEAYSSNGVFFPINGGSDGLRTRNIQIRATSGSWFMFDVNLGFGGSWRGVSPYTLCGVNAWYHFRVYQGGSC